jgi:hypothetical protein
MLSQLRKVERLLDKLQLLQWILPNCTWRRMKGRRKMEKEKGKSCRSDRRERRKNLNNTFFFLTILVQCYLDDFHG